MQQIEVTIAKDGAVTVEAKGVRGAGCKALTAAIENAIGTVTEDVRKPEFMQAATVNQNSGSKASAGQ